MLAFNLRQVGKMKQAWYMIIGSMIFYGVLLTIMKSFHLGSLIEYIVTNTILGLLMAFPVWDYLIPDVAGFKTKSVLIPIISSCVLWGSLLIISQIFIKK
jgi:predicted membrane protein